MKGWTKNDVDIYERSDWHLKAAEACDKVYYFEERQQSSGRKKRQNKYNVSPAHKRRYNGRTYDSKAEMEYAKELYMLKKGGDILEFIEQPKLWLGVPENVYYPDFFIVYKNPTLEEWLPGRSDRGPSLNDDTARDPIYVDVKGRETPAFIKNVKLWRSYGTLDLHIVKKKGKRFVTTEIILPKKS